MAVMAVNVVLLCRVFEPLEEFTADAGRRSTLRKASAFADRTGLRSCSALDPHRLRLAPENGPALCRAAGELTLPGTSSRWEAPPIAGRRAKTHARADAASSLRRLLRTVLATGRAHRRRGCPVCRTSILRDDDAVLLHGRRAHLECAERERRRFR